MADTFTDFILKPAPHFAAGVILFGAVWGFFKGVESILSDDTKLEIWVWLAGAKPLGPKVEPWPDTFAKVFDRLFGKTHVSLECFTRSAGASVALSLLTIAFVALRPSFGETLTQHLQAVVLVFVPYALAANVLPDYVALLSTRFAIYLLQKWKSPLVMVAVLLVDLVLTIEVASIGALIGGLAYTYVWRHHLLPHGTIRSVVEIDLTGLEWWGYLKAPFYLLVFGGPVGYGTTGANNGLSLLLPAFFTSIWLWLYAGSGFLLKGALHFDKSLGWFNRRFDIEKKPLSSIGLVAGALVALVYWAAVIVSRAV